MNSIPRYSVTTGFNSKQLWVYDAEKDAYIRGCKG